MDPIVSFTFHVDFQGMVTGPITEISGLSRESEVTEQKITIVGKGDFLRKIPGRTKYGDVTLKRPLTSNLEFWAWRKLVVDGKISEARKTGTITMFNFNNALAPIAEWTFERAWPSKVSGPSMDAKSSDIVYEELSITYESMIRTK
jgi:phage tail-like protein